MFIWKCISMFLIRTLVLFLLEIRRNTHRHRQISFHFLDAYLQIIVESEYNWCLVILRPVFLLVFDASFLVCSESVALSNGRSNMVLRCVGPGDCTMAGVCLYTHIFCAVHSVWVSTNFFALGLQFNSHNVSAIYTAVLLVLAYCYTVWKVLLNVTLTWFYCT